MNRDQLIAFDLPDARPRLVARLAQARALTDALFDSIQPEFMYERPIAERHRIIFYLGHLEAFDWNLLSAATGRGQGLAAAADADFHRLFAFGIDPLGTTLPQDQPADWPRLPALHHYRQAVRDGLDEVVSDLPCEWPNPWAGRADHPADAACLLNVAIEHRLMHAETLAYMLHRLPVGALRPNEHPAQIAAALPPQHPWHPRQVDIPAGPVVLGESRSHAVFGWDNEFGTHEQMVPAFAIDQCMVTNGQYLAFMAEGGYECAEHWTADDWAWRVGQGIEQPVFWRRSGGEAWRLRAMHHELPLPLDWPVYVSHAEARAYAHWAGKALPTEAQWMRAAMGVEALDAGQCNADFRRWDPQPVHLGQQLSQHGVMGLFGNGWEWTSTPFAPFDGFEPFAFYPGYSKDFFDGQHFVLKGGSPRTAACLLRPSFRNWFQAHYQHAYAGFRCVSPF